MTRRSIASIRRVVAPALAAGVLAGGLAACAGSGVQQLPPVATYRIQGSMESQGRPLTTASIVLERSPLGAMTDNQGRFDLGPLRAGSYEVRVLYLGFRSRPGDVPIPGPGEGTRTFEMFPVPGKTALADTVLPVTVTFRVVED